MPPRRSSAQARAQLRRLKQQQRQIDQRNKRAVDDYNRKARKAVNDYKAGVRQVNREIDRYNTTARAHNTKVRQNRDRLRRELARLEASNRTGTVRVTHRTSVRQLVDTYQSLEDTATAHGWLEDDLFAASAAETANSAAALNALLAGGSTDATDDEVAELQATRIDDELIGLDPDLDQRWRGALFSLNPRNPDAARHFCTSAREMLSDILSTVAPTQEILASDPDCERTQEGRITRRARIRYCLHRSRQDHEGLAQFIEADIENVLALFSEFNSGTHGAAGQFTIEQLRTLKSRVEDAVLFVLRIASA